MTSHTRGIWSCRYFSRSKLSTIFPSGLTIFSASTIGLENIATDEIKGGNADNDSVFELVSQAGYGAILPHVKNFQESNRSSNAASMGKALKISTELVAAVVVGTTLGFILDNWFDTRPWLTITFFFMGVAAGILNVIRSAKSMQKHYKNNRG